MVWWLIPLVGLILILAVFFLMFAVIQVLKIPILIIIGIIMFDMIGNWLGALLKLDWRISYSLGLGITVMFLYFLYQSWWGLALLGGSVVTIYLLIKGIWGSALKELTRGFGLMKTISKVKR